ncbi:MAG: tRNA (guanosine(37)-N1)-methyltransferase TrmD [Gammaproteobacteria bacterium]|nr:tRNA (guanosine(37)-N1)-methyltransferase TrmD [Gammaproteobacteria bacterium]
MRIDVISIFPPMFEAVRGFGIPSRAIRAGLLSLQVWNPRDYTEDKHRSVDDRPYGGGPGMLMRPEPLARAINAARADSALPAKVLYLSPQGRQLDHAGVIELVARERLILLAGRYEGVDERLIEAEVDEEWSIGDYVLSGGELPAMVLIDAIARQLPGALGDEDSATEDSFVSGMLDCPHYTRPELYEGQTVPEVLLSGDHERIRRWRLKQALGRTWLRRPELLARLTLTKEQQKLLAEFQTEWRPVEE